MTNEFNEFNRISFTNFNQKFQCIVAQKSISISNENQTLLIEIKEKNCTN